MRFLIRGLVGDNLGPQLGALLPSYIWVMNHVEADWWAEVSSTWLTLLVKTTLRFTLSNTILTTLTDTASKKTPHRLTLIFTIPAYAIS